MLRATREATGDAGSPQRWLVSLAPGSMFKTSGECYGIPIQQVVQSGPNGLTGDFIDLLGTLTFDPDGGTLKIKKSVPVGVSTTAFDVTVKGVVVSPSEVAADAIGGGRVATRTLSPRGHPPVPVAELLDHRAHRPRQVDPRRSAARDHAHDRRAPDDEPGPRLDGPRAEKGITIKARAVRLEHTANDGLIYGLNLIDTPGHVDFAYEVSRSLQACEGAILVVDAAQGIEAQTLANVHLALREGLTIIPVINKIDLPSAQPDVVMEELENVLAIPREEVILASAKEGIGVPEILQAIVDRIPPPKGDPDAPLQGLVFDSPLRRRTRASSATSGSPPARSTTTTSIRLMQSGARGGAPGAGRVPAAARAGGPPRGRRGGLRRDGAQERPRGPGRRHGHDRRASRRRSRSPATRRRRASCSRGCTRSAAPTTRCCATPSRSSTSTTRRSRTSRRAPSPSGSGSAAGSWACSTWRSSRSASSASSTSTSSPPPRRSSTACS